MCSCNAVSQETTVTGAKNPYSAGKKRKIDVEGSKKQGAVTGST